MKAWTTVFILVYSTPLSRQYYEENGVVGDPSVDCGESHITVSFDTFGPFEGIVFVRKHLTQPECRSPPKDDEGHRNTSIRIKLTDCDTDRRISQNPLGIFVTTNLVVAFHPEFLTKHDRVYQVRCFYMSMEQRLYEEVDVDMPGAPLQTAVVPMPLCKYEVLDGSPTGPPVLFAKVGQMVYHKWTCETDTTNTFCMRVHSCTVDDGEGNTVELIDEKGCAHDRYLLQNLEYISDLMVGKEAHVYKYADRQNVFYECQIAITVKEPKQEYCEVPECEDPKRRKRSEHIRRGNGTVAVFERNMKDNSEVEFITLDSAISSQNSVAHLLNELDTGEEICMNSLLTWTYVGINALIVIIATFVAREALLQLSAKRHKSSSTLSAKRHKSSSTYPPPASFLSLR